MKTFEDMNYKFKDKKQIADEEYIWRQITPTTLQQRRTTMSYPSKIICGVFFLIVAAFMVVSGWLINFGDAGQDPVFVKTIAGCMTLIGGAAAGAALAIFSIKT